MLTQHDPLVYCALAVLLLIGCFWPRLGDRYFRAIEHWGSRLATHPAVCAAGVALLVVLLRLVLLPWDRIPIPSVHDEFSYLLAADTFAHGRLTNPPLPLQVFFETFHVNVFPTYQSKYPPAQGAVLAIGQLLGHPWIGVLLSMTAMCGVITWMMQGWLPARWALLGGLLTAARFFGFSYWMDSYWGGAVAATGGALALGALPRLLRHHRWRDGILLGLGIGILANSRPYEGMIFCLPLAGALGWWLLRDRRDRLPGARWRVVASISCMLVVTGAFMAYYNWRGTGNALLFPYVVNQRIYFSTPLFTWQETEPPRHYGNAQFDDYFNGLSRELQQTRRLTLTLRGIGQGVLRKLNDLQGFYLPTAFFLPVLAALPWLLRNQKARFLLVVCACTAAGTFPVLWFLPHYAAPMTAAALGVSMIGLRYIRAWTVKGRRVGLGLSRALVISHLLPVFLSLALVRGDLGLNSFSPEWSSYRQQMEAQLESKSGQQLVLVRYTAQHNPEQEWVYNRADIGHAKVVWAREIPGEDLRPLFDYFRSRQVWLIEADTNPPKLETYPSHPNR